jgi:hypothetical protein
LTAGPRKGSWRRKRPRGWEQSWPLFYEKGRRGFPTRQPFPIAAQAPEGPRARQICPVLEFSVNLCHRSPMTYVKLLSPEALFKFDKEFGVTYIPPKREERVTVTRLLPDDYPHMSMRPAWKKKNALMEAQNHRCAYCQIEVKWAQGERLGALFNTGAYATIDHVIARSRGGRTVWSNEVIACALCNGGRGDLDAMRYFNKVQAVGRQAAAIWGCMAQGCIAAS